LFAVLPLRRSLPVTMGAGDSAKMGSTVVRGETEATVEVRQRLVRWLVGCWLALDGMAR
jgi:hypothetical protein